MKWILFLIPTIAWSSDFISEKRYLETKDLVEYSIDDQVYQNKKWSIYLSDSCTMYDRNVQNEQELRQAGLRRCKDGSVSFVQPESEGWNGWEGKCGPTAASNSLYHLCKKGLDPKKYVERYMSDITPGVRPGTLRKGLKKIFSLNKESCPKSKGWFNKNLRTQNNFIATLKQDLIPKYSHPSIVNITRDGRSYLRNPVMVLIQNPGDKFLHWVTVIDITKSASKCDFVVNHWNKQYLVPCEKLAQWSGKVGKTYPIILKSYSVVTYQ